jgi:hypothetical protein
MERENRCVNFFVTPNAMKTLVPNDVKNAIIKHKFNSSDCMVLESEDSENLRIATAHKDSNGNDFGILSEPERGTIVITYEDALRYFPI